MPRKKSIEAIDAKITRLSSCMTRLQKRYEQKAKQLKALQLQKRQIESDAIMTAYLKSGKSFEEIMTFLSPNGL